MAADELAVSAPRQDRERDLIPAWKPENSDQANWVCVKNGAGDYARI